MRRNDGRPGDRTAKRLRRYNTQIMGAAARMMCACYVDAQYVIAMDGSLTLYIKTGMWQTLVI